MRLHAESRDAGPARAKDAVAPPEVRQTLDLPGQPLETADRVFMESRFGHDFGKVRVHHDSVSTAAVNALAYTVGSQVVFGPGTYNRRLLAHELAHVVQQSGSPIPSHELAVNLPGGSAEKEASAAAGLALAGGPLSPISHVGASVARATVSEYGGHEQLAIDRATIATAKSNIPGREKLETLFQVVHMGTLVARFAANDEERDAVYDVAWQVKPAKVTSEVEIITSIPARGTSAAVKYSFKFKPKDPAKGEPRDRVEITFLVEGAGATIVTPSPVPGAKEPAGVGWSGFPGSGRDYFAKFPNEGLQLFGWIAAQKGDAYDQVIATSEPTPKHDSALHVSKKAGDPEITVELLGEFRPPENKPGADYHNDHADDLIAKAKTKGDPGQKTAKPDKLGAVTVSSDFSKDELFSVKYFAYSLFATEVTPTKTSPGLRDAESKGVVNVEGSTKQVLIRVTISKSATATGTFDMDVQRVGEVGKDAEIDPAKAKPDIARAVGYPAKGDEKAVLAFVAKRYKALTGVTGATAEAVRASANKLLETEAVTPAYFDKNYGVSVLGDTAAATRLQDMDKLPAGMTRDMGNFTDPEMWSLELSFATLSDPLITLLAGTAFTRQKEEIVDKGSGASPRFVSSNKHSGNTFGHGAANDRTVVLYDSYKDGAKAGFLGGTAGGILPVLAGTILHEMGHAVDASTSARAAFNAKFGTRHGFTDYARGDMTKEFFEEAFAIFQGDPEWLKTNHHDIWEWFTKLSTTGTTPPSP